MTQVLDGIRVLEVALYAYVPIAGAILADWGADVVKVEHPEYGDPMRGTAAWGIPAYTNGFAYLYELSNRGKRAMAVDLKVPEGLEVVLRLAEQADVFMTNFLPSARRSLGIDVADVMGRNPRIVYARGNGQGARGPDADRGGFDGISYWSRSGAAISATPPEETWPNAMPGPGFGDVQSGMALAGGIAAGLLYRERTGRGVVVDGSLLAMGMWAMQPTIVAADLVGLPQLPYPDREVPPNPLANTYRTSDGRFIMLAMLQSDRYWAELCTTMGRPDLAGDQRFATAEARESNTKECTAILTEVFATLPLEEWRIRLASQEGQWDVVNLPGELEKDPQVVANGYLQEVSYGDGRSITLVPAPVQFDEEPGQLGPAPQHGAHTDEVLLELGLDWDEIIQLKLTGAVG